MAKAYLFKFAPGNPTGLQGLSPTFVIFNAGGTAIPAPAISATQNGFYTFSYGPTLPAVAYLIDGGPQLAPLDRYLPGVLDPVQGVDQQIGFVATDSYGGTAAPTTLAGMLKRFIEQREGDALYSKTLGLWKILSRNSAALLRTKQVSDPPSSSSVTGSS